MRTPDRDLDEDDDDFEDENRDSLTDVPGGVRLQKVVAGLSMLNIGQRQIRGTRCAEILLANQIEAGADQLGEFIGG